MLPVSYSIQPELAHVGEIGWGGGFADVSKGEHRGRPVAVKHLKIRTADEFDKVFKVSNRTWPGTLRPLSFNPGALSGSSNLETPISSKCLALVGGFHVEESPVFPHHL